MENKLQNFNYELHMPSKNEYVLNYQDKYFKIETLLYKILLLGQTSKSINEIHQNLNVHEISLDDLNKVINNKILPVFEQKKESNKNNILGTIDLIERFFNEELESSEKLKVEEKKK